MPNLTSLTLREVQERFLNQNIKLKMHGSGKVSRFEPQEDSELKENQRVEIWLVE